MTGILIYDPSEERLAIDDNGNLYHLHSGDVIEVERKIITESHKTIWIPARVEYSHDAEDWYLVGMYKPGKVPAGLIARI